MAEGYIELVNACPDITIVSLKQQYPSFFYNQDWYEDEPFAHLPIPVGKHRFALTSNTGVSLAGPLPLAGVCTWAFLKVYWAEKRALWPNNYIWCKDTDSQKDQVFVGGYNLGHKKGFEIHRFIKLKPHHHSIDYSFSP